MTKEYVFSKLCYKDERNPDNTLDPEDQIEYNSKFFKDDCYCDNCYYGRAELAEEILRLTELINVDNEQ